MEGWKELVLNLPGLAEGVSEIKTTVNTDFFTLFAQSPITRAEYQVRVLVDKKPNLYILNIEATGWYEANCDRCLELIQIPGEASYQYFVNVKGDAVDTEADEDVLVLEEGATRLDLRPLVYESIVISLPMINVYNCEDDDQSPCDPKVLEILREQEQKDLKSANPTWDVLKNLKFED